MVYDLGSGVTALALDVLIALACVLIVLACSLITSGMGERTVASSSFLSGSKARSYGGGLGGRGFVA